MASIRYEREGLRVVRVTVPAPPPVVDDPQACGKSPPLPLRTRWTAPPPPTFHERVAALVPPRAKHAGGRPREESRVTAAQLRRARALAGRAVGQKRLGQRVLAEACGCSRSAIAEAERGRRPVLPTVADWVERVLRDHGAWSEAPPEEVRA